MIKLLKQHLENRVLKQRLELVKEFNQFPYLSKRFILLTYLGLTEEQLNKNNELWREENGDADLQIASDKLAEEFAAAEIEITDTVAKAKARKKGLRGIGITL